MEPKTSQEVTEAASTNESSTKSMHYSREEYAKKEFWDDRFKETKGFFDWYANWKEVQPSFEEALQDVIGGKEGDSKEELANLHSHQTVLMVGCGNSKMSQEMAVADSYWQIYNMDISAVVLDKMKTHHDSLPTKIMKADKEKTGVDEQELARRALVLEKLKAFEYLAMDATRMDFRDNSFDIVIDKGTYDALACGTVEGQDDAKQKADKKMIKLLTQEMVRVVRKGGAVVIISNGTPEKRMDDLTSFCKEVNLNVEITHKKLELSNLAQMINIMRSKLGEKSLSQGMRDPTVLKATLSEMARINQIKKEEDLMKDPKKKLFGMLLKAKRLREEKQKEELEQQQQQKEIQENVQTDNIDASKEEEEKSEKETTESSTDVSKTDESQQKQQDTQEGQDKVKPTSNITYAPKRQNFCMMYILKKI